MIIVLLFVVPGVNAQFSLTGVYYQDFQGLGTNDLSGILSGDLGAVDLSLTGWYFRETGAASNQDIPQTDGSNLQGDTYHFGAVSGVDRALGAMQSGSVLSFVGFWFVNNTGSTITSLTIVYTGEQWRLGNPGRNDRMDFQYSQNATALDNGYWLDENELDFIAPVSTGNARALDGNHSSNRVLLSITIHGLHVPEGSAFFIRWTDFNATGADDGLAVDDFAITPGFLPAATGYFRSAKSGEWTKADSWEYADDNVNWFPSSYVPTAAADNIVIRNGHIIAFNGFLPLDEVQIEDGGVCDFRNGILTVSVGSGGGVNVLGGGVLALSGASNTPVFTSAAAHIDIHPQGVLRVAAGGLTNSPGAGVHASNFIYHHQSILEFDLPTAFGTVGVTYFPNADATTIPVFRMKQNIGVSVGSVSNTAFNGIFEALGNITFANSGHKIFRNGIRGTGNINGSSSGKFIINGHSAELGGQGSLTVPVNGGLEIGSASGTTVSLSSSKSITGNVSFIPNTAGNYINTGGFELSISGSVSGGSLSNFVRTGSEGGSLTLRNIGSGGKFFPVGEASYNPLLVSTVSGNADISVKLRSGIHDPGTAIPGDAVMRTWYIKSNVAMAEVQLAFQYGNSPGELNGMATTQPTAMELLRSDQQVWHLVTGNNSLFPIVVAGPAYLVTTVASIALSTQFSPFCLGKSGTIILPGQHFVSIAAIPFNEFALIRFEVGTDVTALGYEIQRSTDGILFHTIGIMYPVGNLKNYQHIDQWPASGKNYYRVKASLPGSPVTYSAVVLFQNEYTSGLSIKLAPNPAHHELFIEINSSSGGNITYSIMSVDGRLIKSFSQELSPGKSSRAVDLGGVAPGVYILLAELGNEKVHVKFVRL